MKNNSLTVLLSFVLMMFACAAIFASDDDPQEIENVITVSDEPGINGKPLEIGENKLRGYNEGPKSGNDNPGDYNEDLKSVIERLENRIEELVKINEELGYRAAELRIDNYAWVIEMMQLINANDQLRNRVNELENLASDITGLVISSEELRNTAYELLNANIELTHNNELMRNIIEELEADVKEMLSLNEQLNNENEQLRAENEELKVRIDELRRWADSITQPAPVTPTSPAQEPPVQITAEREPVQVTVEQEQPPAEASPPVLPSRPDFPPSRVESVMQMGMTPQDTEINFSRIVRATAGQILEIPFRGSGWVYLGEIASRRGIDYNSRRNDSDGQSFIFSLEEAGTYVLRFYRQDFIRNYIINDHVQVIVGEAPAAITGWFNPSYDRGRVVAQPRWPSALEEAQIISGARPSSQPYVSGGVLPQEQIQSAAQGNTSAFSADPFPGGTQVFNPQSADTQSNDITSVNEAIPQTPLISADVLLQNARESFDRGNIASAITSLAQYMDYYPADSDEALWLLGQLYEANSPNRDINRSLDYYRRLTNEYPQSGRFEDARRRISYLERFYITIQ